MSRATASRRQRGLALVELALVLVILGILGVLLVRWIATVHEERALEQRTSILARADDALLAFAAVHHRLPCPAADAQGVEDCARHHGRFPWRTAGLPDASASHVRYGVLRRTDATGMRLDADLASARDRAHPITVTAGAGYPAELGAANGLDFCHALRVGMRLPFSADAVHTHRPDAPASAMRNVAYALAAADPADVAGFQHLDGPGFASPRRPDSADHRDEVIAVGLDQLWTRLRCGDAVAAVTYAHFNLAAAAGIDEVAMEDYAKQLEILQLLAQSNMKNAEAGVLSAEGGIVSATASITEVAAEILKVAANPEMFPGDMATKPVEMGFAVASLATATAALVSAEGFRTEAGKSLRQVEGLLARIRAPTGLPTKSAQLAQSLKEEATLADRRGARP